MGRAGPRGLGQVYKMTFDTLSEVHSSLNRASNCYLMFTAIFFYPCHVGASCPNFTHYPRSSQNPDGLSCFLWKSWKDLHLLSGDLGVVPVGILPHIPWPESYPTHPLQLSPYRRLYSSSCFGELKEVYSLTSFQTFKIFTYLPTLVDNPFIIFQLFNFFALYIENKLYLLFVKKNTLGTFTDIWGLF
jgi:hypothetical protein